MLNMSIREIVNQRDRFQCAPSCHTQELPLLEKQAVVDEVLRGMPIKQLEVYEEPSPNGKVYKVTRGWQQLSAILDFVDGKFPTWTAEEMQRWQQQHRTS